MWSLIYFIGMYVSEAFCDNIFLVNVNFEDEALRIRDDAARLYIEDCNSQCFSSFDKVVSHLADLDDTLSQQQQNKQHHSNNNKNLKQQTGEKRALNILSTICCIYL